MYMIIDHVVSVLNINTKMSIMTMIMIINLHDAIDRKVSVYTYSCIQYTCTYIYRDANDEINTTFFYMKI